MEMAPDFSFFCLYVKNVYFFKTKKTRAHFEYLFVHSVCGW